jgi:hypothetical protein
VGGLWEEIGRLQFEFLLRQGLAPSDCFLDIACGSLRGGVHFINYLNPGNYLGIEKQRRLVELGIEKELGREALLKQKPEFLFSGDFEFHRFSKIPSYSIAQSLLTHLAPSDIHTCLRNLRAFVKDGHVAFATFIRRGFFMQQRGVPSSRLLPLLRGGNGCLRDARRLEADLHR